MSPLRNVTNQPSGSSRARSDLEASTTTISPQQFVEYHEQHVDGIYAYVARRLGRDLAEDITAETFTAAWAGRDLFDPTKGPFGAWLFGIASNQISRHHRTEERRWRAYARTGVDPLADVDSGRSDEQGLVERLAAESDWPRVAGALAALSVDDRSMLLLSVWHDLSYPDIAQIFDLPLGTVKSRLSRARKKLFAHPDVTHVREPSDE